MAFVKYTEKLQDLVNRGQAALNKTTLKEEYSSFSRRTADVDTSTNGTGYNGMFCLRIQEIEVEQEGQEEPVLQKILTVTDGYNGGYTETDVAGIAFVNGTGYEIQSKSFPIEIAESLSSTIGIVYIKYTQPHDAYIRTSGKEDIEIPAEEEKIELIYRSVFNGYEKYTSDDLYHTYFPIGRVKSYSNMVYCVQDHTGFAKFNAYLYLPSLASGYLI